jgi:hypothetical protein
VDLEAQTPKIPKETGDGSEFFVVDVRYESSTEIAMVASTINISSSIISLVYYGNQRQKFEGDLMGELGHSQACFLSWRDTSGICCGFLI